MLEYYTAWCRVPHWISLPLLYFVWVGAWWIVKRIGFHTVRRLTRKTATKIDDLLINAANLPLTLLIFSSGGAVIERLLPLPDDNNPLSHPFLLSFKLVAVLAIIIFIDKFLISLAKLYEAKYHILRMSSGIANGLIHAVIFGTGSLVLLGTCGISITPVVASLGIGSLAVALALQPTLENLFSGVQLVIDRPIQVGQFIRLESGEEGFVQQINWRCTWILIPTNNVLIVPNKALVNSRILNYYYPGKDLVVAVAVGVHYNSDLDQVEKVTLEIAREIQKELPGAVREFEPIIRYHTLGDYSIQFNTILRAAEFPAMGLLKHEFLKRLLKRYAQEGIVIPYPIQAINVSQEKSSEVGYKV